MNAKTPMLCVAIACLMLPSCELQREKVLDLETKKLALEKEKRDLTEKLRVAEAELEVTRKSRDEADTMLGDLRADHEKLKANLDKTRREFEDYRTRFQLESRISAVGQTHLRLATTRGRAFHDARIRVVLGDSIHISHAEGAARLPLADLPESWWQRFDFTPGVPCRIPDERLREACAAVARERF